MDAVGSGRVKLKLLTHQSAQQMTVTNRSYWAAVYGRELRFSRLEERDRIGLIVESRSDRDADSARVLDDTRGDD